MGGHSRRAEGRREVTRTARSAAAIVCVVLTGCAAHRTPAPCEYDEAATKRNGIATYTRDGVVCAYAAPPMEAPDVVRPEAGHRRHGSDSPTSLASEQRQP